MKFRELFEKIDKGDLDFLVEEIKKYPEIINTRDDLGRTILQRFVSSIKAITRKDYKKVFNYLINLEGVDLYARDNNQHNLLIHLFDNTDIKNKNRNYLDFVLVLPGFKAKEEGEYLLLHITKILNDSIKNSIILSKCYYERYVYKLIYYGADINVKHPEYGTIAHQLLRFRHRNLNYKFIEKLIKGGLSLDFELHQELYLNLRQGFFGLSSQTLVNLLCAVTMGVFNNPKPMKIYGEPPFVQFTYKGKMKGCYTLDRREKKNEFYLEDIKRIIDNSYIEPELLFEKNKNGRCFFEVKNSEGDNILHFLAKRDELEFLKELLAYSENFIFEQNNQGDTLMHILASKIQEKRADIYIQDSDLAKIEENQTLKTLREILKIITDMGRDFEEIKNNIGETCSEILKSDLFSKKIFNSANILTEARVKILLRQMDYFARKKNLIQKDESTPELFALFLNSGDGKFFMSSKNPVNMQDIQGNSPLHVALSENNPSLALALMKYNPDRYLVNNEGKLPIHVAVQAGVLQEEILQIYNLDAFELKDANGLNVFDLLSLKSFEEMEAIVASSETKIKEAELPNISPPQHNYSQNSGFSARNTGLGKC